MLIPETNIPLSAASMQILQNSVNPLEDSSDGGIDLYRRAVHVQQVMCGEDLID